MPETVLYEDKRWLTIFWLDYACINKYANVAPAKEE